MDDLRTILDQLEDNRLDYVISRSKAKSDARGFRDAGIAKTTFYGWSEEERMKLNDLAQKVKRENALRAIMILQDSAEEAAQVKINGMRSRRETIQQAAASEILDRTIGKPVQKSETDLTSGGKKIVVTLKAVDD